MAYLKAKKKLVSFPFTTEKYSFQKRSAHLFPNVMLDRPNFLNKDGSKSSGFFLNKAKRSAK